MKSHQTTDMFLGASKLIFERAKGLRLQMTEAEVVLWEHLKNSQLKGFRFRRQHPLLHYIADFCCHEAGLVVELDGAVHENSGQIQLDEGRTYDLSELGVKVIRFSNEQVLQNTQFVVNEILICLPDVAKKTKRQLRH